MKKPKEENLLILAGAARDAAGVNVRPAAIRVAGESMLEVGRPDEVRPRAGERVIERPGDLILPGLVNAHAHLDLSHVGPIPCDDGDFTRWVDAIRSRRGSTPGEIAAATRTGIELALRGGTAFIGDIAGVGSLAASEALDASPLGGVSFVEFFGIGAGEEDAIARMRATADRAGEFRRVRLGLQPHAPYSAGVGLYLAAARLSRGRGGLPLSTHLAETTGEIEFTTSGTGPHAELLRRIGTWDDSIRPSGLHPIEHLAEPLAAAKWLVAHVNYADSSGLAALAASAATIAYCPRASAYFGHRYDEHPYRDYMRLGGRVALGTDSLVCLDTPGRISPLDEMRLLYRRDRVDAETLLAMATTIGAAALGVDIGLVTLAPGRVAGLIAIPFDGAGGGGDDEETTRGVDPLERILAAEEPPAIEWVLRPR